MIDIKELAKDFHKHREAMTVADIETLLQGVYQEGMNDNIQNIGAKIIREKLTRPKFPSDRIERGEKPNINPSKKVNDKSKQRETIINTQPHYKGKESLYKFAEDWELNAWEFDVIKRLVRCRHKGQFKEDLQKTRDLLDIYEKEYKPNK